MYRYVFVSQHSQQHICMLGGIWQKLEPYNPHQSKLDSLTISDYYICCLEKSKRIRFYCPNQNPTIIESENARLIVNDKVNGRNDSQNVITEEVQVDIPLVTSPLRTTPIVVHWAENFG